VADEPSPSPSGSGIPSSSAGTDPTPASIAPLLPLPVAFSVDGRRLYGATLGDRPPTHRPVLQVDLGGSVPTISAIDRYPTGASERLAPIGWPGEMVDPATGRIAEVDYSGPRPALTVVDPGGQIALRMETDEEPSALTWTEDGRLLASVATPLDTNGEASSFSMHWVEPDGSLGPVVLSAERVNGAGQWASRPGWALIGFQADSAFLFALLRTADGATATVRLRDDDFPGLSAIELVDSPERR
jgi:hypothetical protein